MGKIKKIIENELIGGTQNTDVYPVTSTKAVYDEDNEALDGIIKRRGVVNISTNYNSDHIAEVFTLSQAIAKVPSKDRVLGFQGKFLTSEGWKSYMFVGDSLSNWGDTTKWVEIILSSILAQELGDNSLKAISQKAVTDSIEASNKNTGISEYEKFSESKSYNTGDIVQYTDNLLYEFTTQHPAGAWIGTDIKRISLKGSLSKLENIKASNTLFNKSLEFNRTKFDIAKNNNYLNSKIDINGDIISDNGVTTSVYKVNKGDLFYITPGVWDKPHGDRILYAFYSSSDISNETLLYISDKNITQDVSIVVPNDCYLALTFQDGAGGNKTYYKRDYDNAIIDISNVSGKTFNTLLDVRDYIINSLKTCKKYGLKFQYKDNNNIYNYYQFLPVEINNNYYWTNDNAFLSSCYKIEENSYTYTDDFIINKYVKEIYISGEGIDLSSNYKISIIQRIVNDDYERKGLYLKKEGEEGNGTFFYMDDYSEGRKEYLLDKTVENIRVIAIIDFSSFTSNKVSNSSTGILNKKAFNIIYSPSINNYLNNTSIYNKIDEVKESIKNTTDDIIAKKVDITTYNDGELYKVVKELYIEGSDINPSETYYLKYFRRINREDGNKQFTLYLNDSSRNIFKTDNILNNLEDVNSGNQNFYVKDLNLLILRNKNKYENSTLNLYVIFDYDAMESGVNYGNASIPLNQNTFDLKSSPIIESYLSKIEIENNLSYKAFTTDSETNKYLKELYIYGPGVNPNKKYRVTDIKWKDRDSFPVMFRIYDEDGNWVVGTFEGETIEDVYSTQGSNYKESGVYVKYIIDWDALGRGNSISYIRENKKIDAWITKNAFNINNSPLIRAYDEAQKGGNPLLSAQLSEFNGDINKAIIQVEQTKELPDHVDEDDNDNLLSVEDSEGRNIIEVKNDGSVNIPNGFNSLRLKDSDGNLYEITVDNSTNSLKLARI